MSQNLTKPFYRLSRGVRRLLIAPLSVALLSVACTQTPEKQLTPQPHNTPSNSVKIVKTASLNSDELATVEMAIVPWQISGEEEKKLQPLADYLTKTVGRPFKFQVAKSYSEVVDLLTTGKVALASLGARSYLEARDRDPQIEPLVAPINQATGRPWYTSILVVSKESGIKTVEDIKGKRFAFVDQISTSGYTVPMVHFMDLGIVPERDFAEVKFLGSHAKSKEALKAGLVDAIADDKRTYDEQVKQGKIDPNKYRIIWESDPITNVPIVASSKLSPALKSVLKKAFIEAPEGLIDASGAPIVGYTAVQDSDYDLIRKLQNRLKSK